MERAFQRMTSEGGRFFGMTARQGQTARAAFEQLSDAVEQTKIAFGQALIEELDLKGAARDLQAFATRLRDTTGDARPAIRQFGSLARAGAQIGCEFSRAAIELTWIGFEGIESAFPRVARGLLEADRRRRQLQAG